MNLQYPKKKNHKRISQLQKGKINKNLFVFHSDMNTRDLKVCLGASLGISGTITQGLSGKLKVEHEECVKTGSLDGGEYGLQCCILTFHYLKIPLTAVNCFADRKRSDSLIKDVIGFVKGGITGPSAAQLAVRNAESYRKWGKSLKHNPAVIKYEVHFLTFEFILFP